MDDDIRDRFRGIRKSRPSRSLRRPAPNIDLEPQPPAKISTPINTKFRWGKPKKTYISWLICILVVIAISLVGYLYRKGSHKPVTANTNTNNQSSETTETKPTGTIRLIATGDNLAFDSINDAAKKDDGSYDYLPMMTDFKSFFEASDIRLCNQSTPSGGDTGGISGFPNFNAPTAWSTGFADLGCNLINLASYHMNDKGQAAIDATLSNWTAQKSILAAAGANRSAEDQAKVHYFDLKGLKFAYLAYTTSTNNKQVSAYGVNIYSSELANKDIAEAHKNADIVIVSMDWGTANTENINAEQDQISQNLASQDVDIVIGGGPHVVQPVKVLNGNQGHQTLVWFSLGNFLNSQLPVNNLIGGLAVMDIDIATKQVKSPKLLPTYMHYEWTAAQKSAGTINARHDFKLLPLDLSTEALAKSQNNTTVQAQTDRLKAILNKFTDVTLITSSQF